MSGPLVQGRKGAGVILWDSNGLKGNGVLHKTAGDTAYIDRGNQYPGRCHTLSRGNCSMDIGIRFRGASGGQTDDRECDDQSCISIKPSVTPNAIRSMVRVSVNEATGVGAVDSYLRDSIVSCPLANDDADSGPLHSFRRRTRNGGSRHSRRTAVRCRLSGAGWARRVENPELGGAASSVV